MSKPPEPGERPLWQVALLLYAAIVVLAVVTITTAFAVAQALA